jgi:hypothetical protein
MCLKAGVAAASIAATRTWYAFMGSENWGLGAERELLDLTGPFSDSGNR